VEQPEKHRLLLHLVNYNHRRQSAIAAIEVRCRVPETVREVKLYSPDAEPVLLKTVRTGEETVFTVPKIGVYAIAAIAW
jgi:hypothetical protein